MSDVQHKRREYEGLRSTFDKRLPKNCANCGDIGAYIHHIVPLALGGNNVMTNLVRLCTSCHDKVHGDNSMLTLAAKSRIKRRKSGKWSGGSVPLGYKLEDGEVLIDENYAPIVRLMYKWRYKDALTLGQIAAILNEMAIPTKRGADMWTHNAVNKLVNNPMYFGHSYVKGEYFGRVYPTFVDKQYEALVEEFRKKPRMTASKTITVDGERKIA